MFKLKFGKVESNARSPQLTTSDLCIPRTAAEANQMAKEFCTQNGFSFDQGLAAHECCHAMTGWGVSLPDEGKVTGFGCEVIQQFVSWDASIDRLVQGGIPRAEAEGYMNEGAELGRQTSQQYPHLPGMLREIASWGDSRSASISGGSDIKLAHQLSRTSGRSHRVRPRHAVTAGREYRRSSRQKQERRDPMQDPMYRLLYKIAAATGISYAAKVGAWMAVGLVWSIVFRLTLKLAQMGMSGQSLFFIPIVLLLMLSLTAIFLVIMTTKEYPQFKPSISFLSFWAAIGVVAGVSDSILRSFGA